MKPQQQVCKDTVLIPGGETLIDKTVRVYLSVTHSFLECVFVFSGCKIKESKNG
jgi:hypothetical protein